jgi:hypothetical protein
LTSFPHWGLWARSSRDEVAGVDGKANEVGALR